MYNGRFTWDKNKHDANIKKHGITFPEAATVFDDPNALYLFDENHSAHEERFIIIGLSEKANMLIVCHCYKNGDALVRLISARRANKMENAQYKGGN